MKYILLGFAALLGASCSSPKSTFATGGPVAETTPATGAASYTVMMSTKAQADSGMTTVTAKMEGLPEIIRSTARLTNDENRTWRVGSIAEGRIVRVRANAGDMVVKDQILAELHSHDIHESRANYKRAVAELARAKDAREYSAGVRNRAKRLYDLKAASLENLERTETDLRSAETNVRNAEVEFERTHSHLTEVLGIPADEADVPKTSGDGEDNDLIPVRSPASGVVLTRNVTPGTVVSLATDLFLVSDLSRLWAITEVNEDYLGKLRIGTPVRLFVQAYGQEVFTGRISKLGETLDPQTRTVKVRVEVPSSRGRLKPEMYATTEIELASGAPAVLLPAEALQEIRGQSVAFVKIAADRFEARPVSAGRTSGNSVEVSSGLKGGETVVVQAAFVLKSEYLKASLSGE